MPDVRPFTTQLQAGLGMIQETVGLLRLWQPGETPARLADKAIAEGALARTTARRARNIVAEMFAPRYLINGGEPAARLKRLEEARLPAEDLVQLFFLHTARAQPIFGEFVTDVYWPQYEAGALRLGRRQAEEFIRKALDQGRMRKRWTDSTRRKVAGYLIGCCTDFGLLDESQRSDRAIRRFAIRPRVALYLVYELHLAGLSDAAVMTHDDWRFFGLDAQQTLKTVQELAHNGHLIVQAGGDVIQISWTYPNMEACISALAAR
jgi:hypothetical protein